MCAGFRDRGVLREGAPADVVIYDYDKLAVHPMEVARDLPGGEWRRVRKADGYRYIMVNGAVTMSDGVETGASPGRLLRPATAHSRLRSNQTASRRAMIIGSRRGTSMPISSRRGSICSTRVDSSNATRRGKKMWKRSDGETKLFYQGLIQAAVAILHAQRGNLEGARSLYEKRRPSSKRCRMSTWESRSASCAPRSQIPSQSRSAATGSALPSHRALRSLGGRL